MTIPAVVGSSVELMKDLKPLIIRLYDKYRADYPVRRAAQQARNNIYEQDINDDDMEEPEIQRVDRDMRQARRAGGDRRVRFQDGANVGPRQGGKC